MNFQSEINEIHEETNNGDVQRVKELKLAIARNRLGHASLHPAILYEQTEVIPYIVSNFPSALNASDYVSYSFQPNVIKKLNS